MARAAAASALERGRLSYEQRAWAPAYEQLAQAEQQDRLGADDLELLATSAYMLGRDDEYFSVLERAHRLHVENGDLLRAARAAVLARPPSGATRRDRRGDRLEQPRAAPRRPRRTRQRRAGLPRVGRRLRAGDGVRLGSGARNDARVGGDRRAPRRCGPARARTHGPGPVPHAARPGRRRPALPGRGHGGRDDRGALADRDGPCLLQRHRRLPRGLRAAPGAGVDGRADALVRGAARHGLVHRHLPGAPRRDHAAARLLGGRARGGPQGGGPRWDEPRGRCPGPLPGG